jgi:hypothetical protein
MIARAVLERKAKALDLESEKELRAARLNRNLVSIPLVAPQGLNFAQATWIAHESPPFECSDMATCEVTIRSVWDALFRQGKNLLRVSTQIERSVCGNEL